MLWLVFKIPKYGHKMLWLVSSSTAASWTAGCIFDGRFLNDCFLDDCFFDDCFFRGCFLDGCFCFKDFQVVLTLSWLTLNKSVNVSTEWNEVIKTISSLFIFFFVKRFGAHKRHKNAKQATLTLLVG